MAHVSFLKNLDHDAMSSSLGKMKKFSIRWHFPESKEINHATMVANLAFDRILPSV